MRELTAQGELSPRDLAILDDLTRVRLLTGSQMERLQFSAVSQGSRATVRRRVLGRLVAVGFVATLPRRVGGVRAGSSGAIYQLDSAGHRHLAAPAEHRRQRRPWSIGWPFVQHTLDVAELYVRLRELERAGDLALSRFDAEPASWHRLPRGGTLKPDAYAVYANNGWEQHRWLEVDRATESLPTLRRKLMSYVDAANDGVAGPLDVMPRVMITVTSSARLTALTRLVEGLPAPADALFSVISFATAFCNAERPPPHID